MISAPIGRFGHLCLLTVFAWGAMCLASCTREREIPCPGASHARLVFIGIDGATWAVIGPLIEQGALPSFEVLVREGAHMQHFETLSSTDSPVVWTSVATGRDATDHGIQGFARRLPGGRVIPISSNARRARAIWEIATQRGMSVGVLNWWASWPAEEVAGYVISDHANPAFVEFMSEDGRYWTADPEILARMQRDFFPLDLAPILAEVWLDKAHFPYQEIRRRGGFTRAQMSMLRNAPWNARTRYSILKTFYAADAPMFSAAIRLHCERPVDLQMIYLRGPDPLQHYAWDLVEPEKFARNPPNAERDRGLVEGVYRYLDSFLGDLLEVIGPDTWLLLASDHGAEPVADAGDPRRSGRPGGHTTAAKGVLFIRGPEVRSGHALPSADPLDLMPTMAWLLELPLSEELEGQPLTEAFEPEFVAAHSIQSVVSYGDRETRPGTRSPADESMLESLRALGYIE